MKCTLFCTTSLTVRCTTSICFHSVCTLPQHSAVGPYTLEMLRLAYEENEKQCSKLAVPEGSLRSDECILRVSALIKTDFGNGRIALTDKR